MSYHPVHNFEGLVHYATPSLVQHIQLAVGDYAVDLEDLVGLGVKACHLC